MRLHRYPCHGAQSSVESSLSQWRERHPVNLTDTMSALEIEAAQSVQRHAEVCGSNLVIRAAEPSDASALARLADDESIMLDFGFPRFAGLAWWSRRTCREPESGVCLVAEISADIAAWAELAVNVPSSRAHSGQLGICVHADFRGQGLGRKMAVTLLDLADRSFNLRRLELQVWEHNRQAIQLYESLGFVIEGRHLGYGVRAGQPTTSLSMARLSPHYLSPTA